MPKQEDDAQYRLDDSPAAIKIADADIEAGLCEAAFGGLTSVCVGGGLVYVALALSHWFLLPSDIRIFMTLLAAGTAVFFFGLTAWLRKRTADTINTYAVWLLIFIAAQMNALVHLYFVPEPQQTTNLLIINIAAGVAIFSRRHVGLFWFVSTLAWIGLVLIAPPSPQWLHFGFAYAEALVVGILAHIVRVRAVRRLVISGLHLRRQNKQLEAARHQAEASTRAKSAFLASMSHEIRTPMNGVIGMTSLLSETNLTSTQQDFVNTIRTSGEALLTIINDILDFSKIEAGRMDLEAHPFHLRECIESALDLLSGAAAKKGLELAGLIKDDVPQGIISDSTRLRQILVNLLSNAIKFTEQGEVVLTVAAEPMVDGRVRLNFAVRDTGIGIPAEKLSRLFQPFSQVDASTTRHYGGTGLGLVICKRLCNLMGGDIWVESEAGKGSTFYFTIEAETTTAISANSTRLNLDSLAGKRVMVVDDNETNRRILSLMLERWQMKCQVFANGQSALACCQENPNVTFDIALLDFHMPQMDGLMLAEKLKAWAPKMPCVILSSAQDADPARRQAIDAWLFKPVKQDRLLELLLNLLTETENSVAVGGTAVDTPPTPQKNLRILLAEDNVINQKVALRMLDRLGYRADLAVNGLEVLEALERQPYDVILMDVHMPEMDGLEATRAIRALPQDKPQPWVIAMTADVMTDAIVACKEAGLDDFVGKPTKLEELDEVLSRVGLEMAMSEMTV